MEGAAGGEGKAEGLWIVAMEGELEGELWGAGAPEGEAGGAAAEEDGPVEATGAGDLAGAAEDGEAGWTAAPDEGAGEAMEAAD